MAITNIGLVDTVTCGLTVEKVLVFTGKTIWLRCCISLAGLPTTMRIAYVRIVLVGIPILEAVEVITTITSETFASVIIAPKFLVDVQELIVILTAGCVDWEHLIRLIFAGEVNWPGTNISHFS